MEQRIARVTVRGHDACDPEMGDCARRGQSKRLVGRLNDRRLLWTPDVSDLSKKASVSSRGVQSEGSRRRAPEQRHPFVRDMHSA